jgi:hypothetical protein
VNQCAFDVSWVGRCREAAEYDSEFCPKHNGMKCVSCKARATHDCDHTGALVCGAPLCDGCDGYQEPGASHGFFGFGGHSHRSKQWEAQKENQ